MLCGANCRSLAHLLRSCPSSKMASDLAAVPGLAGNLAVLSTEERVLAEMLVEAGQEHLFSDWPATPADDDRKHEFFEQIARLEASYPGGISGYCENARELLAASSAGKNPFEGLTPHVPQGRTLTAGGEDFLKAEADGVAEMRHAVFVLVAGGLGERLGYGGIKVALPVELTTNRCYLELYIRHILAFQARAGDGVKIPLAIMTSGDTHADTEALLKRHNNFGMAPDQVTLVKQEKVAALQDNEARIARDDEDKYAVQTKPHGHGDVHLLLHQSGLARKWADEGRQWVCFFQDTNALAFRSIPAAVGVSKAMGLHMNSMTIPRKAKDAVGAIVRLAGADGREMTCNVEYNQLDPLLRATVNREGDVPDDTGFSPYPGNTNQLILHLPRYAATLERSGGLMPEFVNPKYKDDTKTTFKKPTRLECMMQDYPRALSADEPVGFTQLDTWISYSPVKNNLRDAAAKAASGTPPACASSGELEYYELGCETLRRLGANVAPAESVTIRGVSLMHGPHVVLDPSFCPSMGALSERLPQPKDVVVAANAALVVEGADITLRSLHLDGALTLRAVPGARVTVENLRVSNARHKLHEFTDDEMESPEVPESSRVRGFRIDTSAGVRVSFDQPGEYVLSDDTIAHYAQ